MSLISFADPGLRSHPPPTRFFFRSGDPYTRQEVDRLIAAYGPSILVGQHHERDQSALVYARSRGARVHWYMLGGGEPARGYNNDGRIRFPSDQREIAAHCREMNMTRAQWDAGGWLQWHQQRLLAARDEEQTARREGRTPRQVLPDTVELDSLNNASPERVAELIANFDRWRRDNGIHTQIVPKNLEQQHLAPIERRIADGSISPGVFAPIHILEEYASPDHVRIISDWAQRRGAVVVQTTNTDNYRSPASGYELRSNLVWHDQQTPQQLARADFRPTADQLSQQQFTPRLGTREPPSPAEDYNLA